MGYYIFSKGIGRLAYTLLMMAMIAISYLLELIFMAGIFMELCLVAFSLSLTFYRIKNMGYSGWFTFLSFIPIANIIMHGFAFCCPPDFKDNKKLDTAGKILLVVYIGFWVFMIASLVAFIFH